MTTDRTAIRRRLAVRGTAYRPPWSGRKTAGHRAIVAPLAATVAATLAVGVGLALARSGRERARARRRRRDRRLGLAPGESLACGLQRMALGQVDVALEQLAASDASFNGWAPGATAVHETRKALKRLRALLRLLEHELGEKTFARENAALRDIAQRLSGARDAEVMLDTLDALIARHPRKLGRRRGVLKLRKRLLAEHVRLDLLTLADTATRAAALGELHAFRGRVAAWNLPERDRLGLVESDLAKVYRQGRRRYRRALRADGDATAAMHEWRKRVKDLRYAYEMLGRRRSAGRLRALARRADALGELLGDEHDLAVLAQRLRAGTRREAPEAWRTGRSTRKLLLDAIARRRRQLRRRALRDGERLYRATPKRFLRRVRAAYDSGARGR
jgi:CHAD domain-containing protein